MSFGFGVGDIIALSKVARSVWTRVRDAPDQFNAIRSEVAGLYLVLEDIAHNASERQLNDKQKKDLSLLINGASSILEELSSFIQRHEGLGNEPLMINSKVEKAWKKVRWDQNVIRDLRFRIISSMTTLDAFNSSLTSKMSQKMIDSIALLDERLGDLQLDKDQRDRQDLLEWISPLNFSSQQNAIFNRRQEGTGQWFFESPEVKTWLSRPGQTLLCTGIPGAGKTMLASMAIEHLQHMFHQKNIPVAYIYCDYKRQQEQSPVTLFASILKQLLQNIDVLPESVMRSYRHHVRVKTRPELKEIHDMLTSLLTDFSQTFIIVDALDELTVYAQVRQIFLSNLRSLQKIQKIHFMMTSRFIPTEVHDFQNILRLEIRASDYDIQRYVYGHMSDLTLSVQSNSKLQETIVTCIVNAVDGMFLLAQLHVESLTDRTTPKAVKKALETLPTGSDALDFAYSQAMQRVEAQKPGFRSLAKQALSWVVYACRLLTAKELCHALAIEIGESVFDEEGLNDVEEIVSVCCGLITIDPETTAVRLVHYTTQEYFKRAGSEHFPNAKEDIATRCLTYLLFDEFETGRIRKSFTLYPMPEVSTLQARLRKYAFLEYAACFWARHAEDYTINLEHRVSILLAQFITDDYKVSSATQVVSHVNRDWRFYQCHSPTPVSGIHLATYFDLSHTVSHMLEIGLFAADVEDCDGETPLVLAARKGNEATLEVLLRRPDVDVNNSTPLALAAKHASLGILELLLGRDDIDVNKVGNGKYGTTPLMFAAASGNSATLKLLLKHKDIIADHRDSHGCTALFAAAASGFVGNVQLLLERGDVDANARNNDGVTPLAIATRNGNIEVVKLLLERQDVDVNSTDKYDQTVLQHASVEAAKELICSAIRERCETNGEQPKQEGSNPLNWSAYVLRLSSSLRKGEGDIESDSPTDKNPDECNTMQSISTMRTLKQKSFSVGNVQPQEDEYSFTN